MLEGWKVGKGEDRRRIQSNHESTKVRKHEGMRDYIKNQVLFRVFVMNGFDLVLCVLVINVDVLMFP